MTERNYDPDLIAAHPPASGHLGTLQRREGPGGAVPGT